MLQAREADTSTATPGVKMRIVDCDVHSSIPPDELRKRLPDRVRRYHDEYGLRASTSMSYTLTRPRAAACRTDAWPPNGGPPGSSMPYVQEQLLDPWEIDYAVLNPIDALGFTAQLPEVAGYLFAALNDWTREEWLDKDSRFLAALCVPVEATDLAVAEIARLAVDERFVHVMVPSGTREPLGHRRYWGIYEATVAAERPLALHIGGIGNPSTTGAGWPSYYSELHVGASQAAAMQLVSMICHGVFERFPSLRVVLQEGGIAWAPPLAWSLDRAWERLGKSITQIERRPSEYLRSHFYFSTQPIEEPSDPRELLTVLDHLDMHDRILFATDYPHWDFDAPTHALPRSLNVDTQRNILGLNAARLYRLPL